MYLAVTLSRLDDIENACAAYEKAISLTSDHMNHLNYAITLYNAGQRDEARSQFVKFEALFAEVDEEVRMRDPDVLEQRQALSVALVST